MDVRKLKNMFELMGYRFIFNRGSGNYTCIAKDYLCLGAVKTIEEGIELATENEIENLEKNLDN